MLVVCDLMCAKCDSVVSLFYYLPNFAISNDGPFKHSAVIEFIIAGNVKLVDIYKRLFVVYRNETLDISSVHRWTLQVKGFEVEKVVIAD